MNPGRTEPQASNEGRRRRLRAVFAADIANFGGLVSVDETKTLDALMIARRIAMQELEAQHGWLFGLPGDGIFALFESALAAVRCALNVQTRLAATPKVSALRMRIGVHLGEVLFHDEMPFGESLCIAARLESLAEPGSVLVSASVMEAVASRISATFSDRGVRDLKHSPRRIATFSVTPAPTAPALDKTIRRTESLDRTVVSVPPALGRRVSVDVAVSSSSPTTELELDPRHVRRAPREMPRLPRATPLVIPEIREAESSRGRDIGLAQDVEAQPLLSNLALALTRHLGPFAKILVRRHAADIGDPRQLVETLADQIPAVGERAEFLHRAHELLLRTKLDRA